ncbi:hypothetical protein SPSIL_029420 [Sporomusa silvacetica DSM 10669]|uniref:Uncharacterized protein n=1 Tax=Sporomusa silvacetica DSM 10669 TaxID=1123289 RepID=A0ABZ3IM60_9FIRM|nr:hypothetical protein [Sporomusa silvacetica]OZC15708.1 hypothetical protein SPSIL_40380 [Sporomusa silvacetica DSM 10669]
MAMGIAQLIKQLYDLGYSHYQIEEIIRETTGTVSVKDLDSQQSINLAQSLEEYIDFAIKCRKQSL